MNNVSFDDETLEPIMTTIATYAGLIENPDQVGMSFFMDGLETLVREITVFKALGGKMDKLTQKLEDLGVSENSTRIITNTYNRA